MVQSIGMVREHRVESGDLGRQVDGAESEVEDAGVWLPLAEHKLAEVTIKRDRDTLIAHGDCQDLRIVKRGSIVGATRATP